MRSYFIKTIKGEAVIKLLSILSTLIAIPYLTRMLGVEQYGAYSYVFVTVAILAPFTTLGLVEYVRRYYSIANNQDKKNLLSVAIIISPFIAIISFVILWQSRLFNIDDKYIPIVFIMMLSMLVFSILEDIAHSELWLRDTYLLKTGYIIGFNTFLIGGIFIYNDITSILWGLSFFYVIWAIFVTKYLWNKIAFSYVDFSFLRSIISHSILGMLLSVSWLLIEYIDRYFIVHYLNKTALGIYSLSSSLSAMSIGLVFGCFAGLTRGLLYKALNENNKIGEIKLAHLNSCLFSILILPVIAGLSFFGEPFVRVFAGDDFISSYVYIKWLILGGYLVAMSSFYVERILAENSSCFKYILAFNIISLLINIILNMQWIPTYGLIGATYATAISHSILGVMLILLCKALHAHFVSLKPMIILNTIGLCVWYGVSLLWDASYGFMAMFVYCIGTMLLYWAIIYIVMNKFVKENIMFMVRKDG